jgi:hypothetical protein
VQTVQHRWLDESAPIKLSPLHAALAHNGLLGPEPLDLNQASGADGHLAVGSVGPMEAVIDVKAEHSLPARVAGQVAGNVAKSPARHRRKGRASGPQNRKRKQVQPIDGPFSCRGFCVILSNAKRDTAVHGQSPEPLQSIASRFSSLPLQEDIVAAEVVQGEAAALEVHSTVL